MKKILSLLISFCIIFFAGCQNETVTNPETNITDTEHNSAPFIIPVVLDELKDIRNILSFMQEDDFREYMYENHYGAFVNGMYTIENAKLLMKEFEECFSRLEFRKIGDLLDEMPEETTKKDSSENEQTSVTENVSVAETTLPEETSMENAS